MPRPMMPTQFTVLTSASTSACNRSPVRYSIIAPVPSKVPVPLDLDWGPVRCPKHCVRDLSSHALRHHADSVYQLPRKGLVDQKLRLLAFLDIGGPEIGGG